METSKENRENTVFPHRNHSDSEIAHSKRLYVIPDEEDLHIVGIRVKLGDQYTYSFDLGRPKSKSAEVLTISRDFKKQKLTAEDRSLCSSSDAEDKRVTLSSPRPNLTKSPDARLKHVAEISIKPSGVQTELVEVRQPTCTQEATRQTDRTRDISTATEEREAKSVKTQTIAIAKKQIPIQTDKEIATGSSQTETAALYSIDRVYDATTQTEQVGDAGTSTDFNIYIVDREDVTEKAVDTEDLPFQSLIVANEEKADAVVGKMFGCLHKDLKEALLERLIRCPFRQFATSSAQCNRCHCPPTTDCDLISKCDENFRIDDHQLHCCKCAFNWKTPLGSRRVQESTRSLKAAECIRVDEADFDSIATRKKIDSQSRVEVAKSLRNTKIVVAERVVQPPKADVVSVLQTPVVFQHYLSSFVASSCRPSRRVVVNPIDITLSGNETAVLGKSTDAQFGTNIENPIDEFLADTREKNLLTFPDGKKTKSVRFCPTPPEPIAAPDNRHPHVSGKGYSDVYDAVGKKNVLQQSSELPNSVKGESVTPGAQGNSTSPMIKHGNFNYTSKDTWKPYDVLDKKVETTDIIYVGESSSDEFFESEKNIGLREACVVVNNHLLSSRPVDENRVRKAAEFLHKWWFKTAGSKYSDARKVKNYIGYFEVFSHNLLKALLHSVDNNGNNVLHFAFANNRFDLAEEILENALGADLLKATNKTGNSPLTICSISQPNSNSEWTTVRRTFEIGDVDSKSLKGGQTALMNASSCGFHAMVDLLLDAGANPNLQDKDGSTALMYAAEHGRETCVKSLLKNKKCDLTIRDKDGQTACSIALSNHHENLAVLIHVHALEKRKQSKNSVYGKRCISTDCKTIRPGEELHP